MNHLNKKLLSAAYKGNVNEVRFLVEQGADINICAKESDKGIIKGYTPTMIALSKGYADILDYAISQGVDIEVMPCDLDVPFYANHEGKPLVYAAAHGFHECVNVLIKNGADVNYETLLNPIRKTNALAEATHFGHLKCMESLLKNGANPDYLATFYGEDNQSYQMSPLMIAVLTRNLPAAELIVQYRANVNLANSVSETALLQACSYDDYDIDIIEFLLKNGADINHKNLNGDRSLMLAAASGTFNEQNVLLELLTNTDVQVNGINNQGANVLSYLCSRPKVDLDTLTFLLEHGCHINSQDNNGITPFMYAVHYNPKRLDLIEFLLWHGADVFIKYKNENISALDMAVLNEQHGIVSVIKSHYKNRGIDIDTEKPKTFVDLKASKEFDKLNQALLDSAQAGNVDIMNFLLEKGADIDVQCPKKYSRIREFYTPLMIAVDQNDIDSVTFLVHRGADIQLTTKKGDSAMMIAAEKGFAECLDKLLQHGANASYYSEKQEESALVCAARNGNAACVVLLIDHGAQIEECNNPYGQTPLNKACCPTILKAHEDVIECLISINANVNTMDKWGNTPLMNARDNLKVCQLLINAQADLTIKNKRGETIMDLAIKESRPALINILK